MASDHAASFPFADMEQILAAIERFDQLDAMYAPVLEHIKQAAYLFDHKRDQLVFVSRSARNVLGHGLESLKHMGEMEIYDHVYPQDRELIRRRREDFLRHLRPGTNQVGRIEYRWWNGQEYIWLDQSFTFFPDEQGRRRLESGLIRDITLAKQRNQALKQAQMMLDSITEVAAYQDFDCTVLWANRAAEENSGKRIEQCIGQKCYEVWHDREQMCENCPVRVVQQTFKPACGEIVGGDGRLWYISAYPTFDETGRAVGITEVARDVTEQKQTQQELQLVQERFQEALKSGRHAMYRFNVIENRYEYTSPHTAEIFGLGSLAELFTSDFQDWQNRIHPDDRTRIRQQIEQVIQEGHGPYRPCNMEYRVQRDDGREVWVSDWCTLAFDTQGRFTHAIGSAYDVTERKQAREQLQQAHDDLERRVAERTAELQQAHRKLLRAREEERHAVAAELHDSLAQQMIVLQLVIERLTGQVDDTSLAQTARTTLKEMIDEVRGMCRGLFPSGLEEFGLVPALRTLANTFQAGGLSVSLDQHDVPDDCRFDRETEIALYRIAQEALTNAVRHSNARHMAISVASRQGVLRLSVTDDGKGFAVDKANGRGLGLQSMRERALAIGGDLEVRSDPCGTTVVVSIGMDSPGDSSG